MSVAKNRFTIILLLSLWFIFLFSWHPANAQNSDLGGIIEEISASVVCFFAMGTNGSYCQGSGFIVDKEGYVLTVAHALSVGTIEDIVVYLSSDSGQLLAINAQVIAVNNEIDMAVLDLIDDEYDYPVLEINTEIPSTIGDDVILLGFPAIEALGWNSITVSRGIVSSLIQSDTGTLEVIGIDAMLCIGGSGGPLYNLTTGSIIGIASGKGMLGISGLNFATPIEALFRWSGTDPDHGINIAIERIRSRSNKMVNLLEPFSYHF